MIFRTPHSNLVMVMEPMTKGSPGRRIRFQDGVYVTSSKEEIDFIKQSRSFGVTIFADEEQPKPKPEEQPKPKTKPKPKPKPKPKRSARPQEILDS